MVAEAYVLERNVELGSELPLPAATPLLNVIETTFATSPKELLVLCPRNMVLPVRVYWAHEPGGPTVIPVDGTFPGREQVAVAAGTVSY